MSVEYVYDVWNDDMQEKYYNSLKCAAVSCAFWFALMWSGKIIFKSYPPYAKLNYGKQLEWRARVSAFTHSVIVAILMTIAISLWPYTEDHDMLWGSTEMVRYIEAISCGYFLWDALVMIIYWKTPSTNFFDGVGLIHGVTCFIVYVTTLRPFGMYYTALHLLFEYSTPFLHIRWFLGKLEVKGAIIDINNLAFLITFFIARNVLGPYYMYLYYLIATYHFWSIFHVVFIPAIIISNLLNFFWFYQIIQVAFGSKRKPVSKDKKK